MNYRLKRNLIVAILCIVGISSSYAQKLHWDIDGKNKLVTAKLQIFYPPALVSTVDLNAGFFHPGVILGYRKIRSPKSEFNFQLVGNAKRNITGSNEQYLNRSYLTMPFELSYRQFGLSMGHRWYRNKKNKGISPIGKYLYLGVDYRQGKVIANIKMPDGNLEQKSGINTFSLDLGLGKEYFINDHWAISFSAHTLLGLTFVTNSNTFNSDVAIDFQAMKLAKNLVVVDYGVSYFLENQKK